MNANNMDGVVKSLEEASTKLFTWFSDNLMKIMLMNVIYNTNNTVNIGAENFDIKISDCEKVSGVKFDHKLNFNSHISD